MRCRGPFTGPQRQKDYGGWVDFPAVGKAGEQCFFRWSKNFVQNGAGVFHPGWRCEPLGLSCIIGRSIHKILIR